MIDRCNHLCESVNVVSIIDKPQEQDSDESAEDNIGTTEIPIAVPIPQRFTYPLTIDYDKSISKQHVPGTSGLYNLGNTCYINSIIQCLSHLSKFKNYITDNLYRDDMITNIKEQITNSSNPGLKDNLELLTKLINTKITFQLDRIFTYLWQDHESTYKTITFCKLLSMKNQKYRYYQQQDTHEFLVDIFDIIEIETKVQVDIDITDYISSKELIKIEECEQIIESVGPARSCGALQPAERAQTRPAGHKIASARIFESFNGDLIKKYRALIYLKNLYQKKYSIIDKLFTVGNIITTECSNCKHKSYNFMHSYWISVDIPEDENSSENQMKLKNLQEYVARQLNKSNKTLSNIDLFLDDKSNNDNSDDDKSDDDKSDDDKSDDDKSDADNSDDDNLSDIVNGVLNDDKEDEDDLNDLNDLMDTGNQDLTLKACLDYTYKNEILDDENKWLCNNCNNKNKSTRKTSIMNLSDYLIIQIKRFTPYGTKDKRIISIPEDLDLSDYNDSASLTPSFKYKLKAINNHIGSLNYGHYYSYIRLDNNTWYEFNDNHIKELSDYNSNNAYLVVYEKINSLPSTEGLR